ncbi:MAG: RNA polymerase sigma factor [Candidatus Brocadiia bacterium]
MTEELDSIVEQHQEELYYYLRYLGAGKNTAEDLLQKTFVVALKKGFPEDVEKSGNQIGWLRGIARNMFLRWCNARERRPDLCSEFLKVAETVWAANYDQESKPENIRALRKCLEELEEKDRKVLMMRYREEYSRKEMAEKLGLTENGVKSLLRRVRARLLKCVEARLLREEYR